MSKNNALVIVAAFLLAISNPDKKDFEAMLRSWYYCKWPVENQTFLNSITRDNLVLFSVFKVDIDPSGRRRASFVGIGPLIFPLENFTGIGGNNC